MVQESYQGGRPNYEKVKVQTSKAQGDDYRQTWPLEFRVYAKLADGYQALALGFCRNEVKAKAKAEAEAKAEAKAKVCVSVELAREDMEVELALDVNFTCYLGSRAPMQAGQCDHEQH